jgi:hypothetical protein
MDCYANSTGYLQNPATAAGSTVHPSSPIGADFSMTGVPHNDAAVEYFFRMGGVMSRYGNKLQSVPATAHPQADTSLGEVNI